MPVIKSASKKLRQDKRRTEINGRIRHKVEIAVRKAAKETKDFSVIAEAYSAIDKAVKKGIFEKNNAAHIKASLAKNVKPQVLKTSTPKTKKIAKKATSHA